MMHQGMIADARPSPTRAAEVVELQLLLSAEQVSALEAAAVRLQLTVGALIRRAVQDLLQSPAVVGFVGEVAGRPTAPQ